MFMETPGEVQEAHSYNRMKQNSRSCTQNQTTHGSIPCVWLEGIRNREWELMGQRKLNPLYGSWEWELTEDGDGEGELELVW